MSSSELWFVKLPNGDVHHVTVDQLDAAFEAGHINANTPVLSDGSSEWTTLGQAAGLDEAPPAPARPAAPSPTPAPVVVSSPAPVSYARAPVSYAPAPASYAPRAAPVSYAPAPAQRAQPSYAPRQAPVSYAPRSAPVSYAPPANSVRPVAMDVGSDLDFGDLPFKKRSRKGWVVAVMALALMGGGVGFAATHGSFVLGESPLVAAAAPPASPPPAAQPLPAAPASPPPVAAPPAAPLAGTLPAMDSSLNPRFSEAQKEKLLQGDKVREDKNKARQSSHGYSSSTSPKYKTSSSFSKGGNKYDPLNSDL